MGTWHRRVAIAVLALATVAVTGAERASPPAPESLPASGISASLSTGELRNLVKTAYFWGLSQVGFYELRYVFTQDARMPAYRGINRLAQNRQLLTAKDRYATTPNASTLYSGGFFDVSRQPMVVMTPKVDDGRYWSIQALDPYAEWFIVAGSQFTENKPQHYLVIGPNWHGRLPPGFNANQVIRARSDTFSIVARIGLRTRDSADFASAHRLMDGITMVPLDMWQQHGEQRIALDAQPKVSANYRSFPRMSQIQDIMHQMTVEDYLQLVSLVINDPSITKRADSAKEKEALQQLARLGLREGVMFDPASMTEAQRTAAASAFQEARQEGRKAFEAAQVDMNGWKLQTSLSYDINDYRVRAGAADYAWGSPVPYQSHTIAFGLTDSKGRPLDAAHKYTLTFDVKQLPPVTEFWELPVYDDDGYFVDNPINRYSATSGLFDAGAYQVEDGKLTFYLQNEPPKGQAQGRNWLPTPKAGAFRLAARFYGPTSPLVDGGYPMPRIVRVDE
ncbi:hypothetical protein PTE30175_00446 [Pandoraea terrae]|uniref:Uncharacterized protein n=1 Tax=Pandoraea terrae TaxID=1537710 RepID=A0A5E4RYH8_9BURK|nr:DUF1254 domain-containing protein [Pandoraea terrae]VVD68506.1 hypothetical protein PTE30175_00446 [Pandoraea terrae]